MDLKDVSFDDRESVLQELTELFPPIAAALERATRPRLLAARFVKNLLPPGLDPDYAARAVAVGAVLLAANHANFGADVRYPRPHSGRGELGYILMGNHTVGHNAEVAAAFSRWALNPDSGANLSPREITNGVIAGTGHDAVQNGGRVSDESDAAAAVVAAMDRFGFPEEDQREAFDAVMTTVFLNGRQPLATTPLGQGMASADLHQVTTPYSSVAAAGLLAETVMRNEGHFKDTGAREVLLDAFPVISMTPEQRAEAPPGELQIPDMAQIMAVLGEHGPSAQACQRFWEGQAVWLGDFTFPAPNYDELNPGRSDNQRFAAELAEISNPREAWALIEARALGGLTGPAKELAEQQARMLSTPAGWDAPPKIIVPQGLYVPGLSGEALHDTPPEVTRVVDATVTRERQVLWLAASPKVEASADQGRAAGGQDSAGPGTERGDGGGPRRQPPSPSQGPAPEASSPRRDRPGPERPAPASRASRARAVAGPLAGRNDPGPGPGHPSAPQRPPLEQRRQPPSRDLEKG